MTKALTVAFECNDYAFAIANSMPRLSHLELSDCNMTNDGLQAILDGCPHLQSLDVRQFTEAEILDICLEMV
ncbi:hypothetical protein L2E82_39759 [Cichorium intybus]|uniref:Uncharacterized protein n=1 Tax=Cichorium intybus TaxID=13427 RepID=A0ACB9AJ25_CICIN|nr:hypothetical protein L2E82_39759 [Cichorium intybus]